MNQQQVDQLLKQQQDCAGVLYNPGWQAGRARLHRAMHSVPALCAPELVEQCDRLYLQYLYENPVIYVPAHKRLVLASRSYREQGGESSIYATILDAGLQKEIECFGLSDFKAQGTDGNPLIPHILAQCTGPKSEEAKVRHGHAILDEFGQRLGMVFNVAMLSRDYQWYRDALGERQSIASLSNYGFWERRLEGGGHENDREKHHPALYKFARSALWTAHAPAINAFRDHLDGEVVRLLENAGKEQAGLYGTLYYNWLLCPEDAALRQRRHQFVKNWPSLYPGDTYANTESREALAARVDESQPTAEQLAAMLKVPTGGLRKLRGRSLFGMAADARDIDFHSPVPPCWARPAMLAQALTAINGMPEPRSRKDMQVLGRYAMAASRFSTYTGHPFAKTVHEMWRARTQGTPVPQFEYSTGREFMRQVHRHIILPLAFNHAAQQGDTVRADLRVTTDGDRLFDYQTYPASFSLQLHLWKARPISDFLRAATGWQDRADHIEAQIAGQGLESKKDYVWVPLTGEQIAPNGVKLTPLTSRSALLHEGDAKQMWNCVAGYTPDCLLGGIQVYHLSSLNDPWMATLGLSVGHNREVKLFQNYAYMNCAPPAEAVQAAGWLIKGINDHTIRADWHQLMHPDRSLQLGYNHSDPAKLQAVFDLYQPLLPGARKGMAPQAWATKVGLYPMIDYINRAPDYLPPRVI